MWLFKFGIVEAGVAFSLPILLLIFLFFIKRRGKIMRSLFIIIVLFSLTGCAQQQRIEKLGMSDSVALDLAYDENKSHLTPSYLWQYRSQEQKKWTRIK